MIDHALVKRIIAFRSKPGNQTPFGTCPGLESLDSDITR